MKIGDGFVRLVGHHAKAAWKADGSLWAWHETLAAILGIPDTDLPPLEVGRDVMQLLVTQDGDRQWTLLLKADGSLWAPQGWGGTVALRRIGCGYRVLASEEPGVTLGLRMDGELVAWGPWQGGVRYRAFGEIDGRSPIGFGGAFIAMWGSDELWGKLGASVLLEKDGGTLWTSRSRRRVGERLKSPKALLQQLELPAMLPKIQRR